MAQVFHDEVDGLVLQIVDLRVNPFKTFLVGQIAAQRSVGGGHPHVALMVAEHGRYVVAAQYLGLSVVVDEVAEGAAWLPLPEQPVVARGGPYASLLVFGQTGDVCLRADFEIPHEVLRLSLEAAQSPAGAHVDVALRGAEQTGDFVAGHGVGAVVGIAVVALLPRCGVEHDDAVVACAHPQVVAVEHQRDDFLVDAHGADDARGGVVASEAAVGAYPQSAVGSLADGANHLALPCLRQVHHADILARHGQVEHAAHLGHHPQGAVAVPCHGIDFQRGGAFVARGAGDGSALMSPRLWCRRPLVVVELHLPRGWRVHKDSVVGAHQQFRPFGQQGVDGC